jgi:hypothetical protein
VAAVVAAAVVKVVPSFFPSLSPPPSSFVSERGSPVLSFLPPLRTPFIPVTATALEATGHRPPEKPKINSAKHCDEKVP